jgi:hypothetical protein
MTYGAVDMYIDVFSIPVLVGAEWRNSRLSFPPEIETPAPIGQGAVWIPEPLGLED